MAAKRRLATTVVVLTLLRLTTTVSGYYGSSIYEDEKESTILRAGEAPTSRIHKVHTYEVTRYIPDTWNKTIRDCDSKLKTKFVVQFSALMSDDGSEYYAHIVNKNDRNCFKHRFNSTFGLTLKQCLENAVTYKGVSFHYHPPTKMCNLYSDWRKQKFRTCKRGLLAEEKVYYLQKYQPDKFRPCKGVAVVMSSAYAKGGSNVVVTAGFKRNYCCCEITKVTFDYLDTENVMSFPGFTYTYPKAMADIQAWKNATTITVYSGTKMIALNQYIPEADL